MGAWRGRNLLNGNRKPFLVTNLWGVNRGACIGLVGWALETWCISACLRGAVDLVGLHLPGGS